MNYAALASQLKSMSKDDIVQGMQSGSIPGWMGLSRLQEMKSMTAAGTQAPPQTSVAQEAAIGMAGGGIVNAGTGPSLPWFTGSMSDDEDGRIPRYKQWLNKANDILFAPPTWDWENSPAKRWWDYATEDVPVDGRAPAVRPRFDAGVDPYEGRVARPQTVTPAVPDMPAPPAEPSGIELLRQKLEAIDSAPSSIPGSPLKLNDLSYIRDMLPGAVDDSEAMAARRANAAEQKDMAKWMGLLQFGAGLSGEGSWSQNLSEAGTGLNQVYGERMAAYNQALQDIEKDAVQNQFANADLMSRNANSSIAIENLDANQRNALTSDQLARMQIDMRDKEARRNDEIEMMRLEEGGRRTDITLEIAKLRALSPGKRSTKIQEMAQREALKMVGDPEMYDSPEEYNKAYRKALGESLLYWENILSAYGVYDGDSGEILDGGDVSD